MRDISERSVADPYRLRLYAVALYDMRLSIDDGLALRSGTKKRLEQAISDSPQVSETAEEVSKWTQLYLKYGERMKAIARCGGGLGALLVIPSRLLSFRQ